MNISGIKPSMGFYEHTSIIFNPVVNLSEIPLAGIKKDKAFEVSADVNTAEGDEKTGATCFGQYDYATRRKSQDIFSLNIASPEVKLSDLAKNPDLMQEDKALLRYQTFVTDDFSL